MIVITVSAFIFGLSLFYIDNKSDNTDARLAFKVKMVYKQIKQYGQKFQ